MTTPAAALVALPVRLRRMRADPLHQAVEHLGHALPRRADATVLLDFLEDDLREGLDALSDVEAHFTDVLEAVRSDEPSPLSLVDAGDDYRVLQRLEELEDTVKRLRRRLSQAAGLMRHTATT